MATPRTLPLGTLLKRSRVAAGLTQEELAERAGVSPRTICDLERGATRRWRHATLSLLAEALQLSTPEREAFEAAAKHSRGGRSTPAVTASVIAPDVAAPSQPAPAHYLPPQLTSLVGREREEAAAVHLLRQPEVRLLTLTGPPGVGKTRLAGQVATGLAEAFADGVGFVPLAAVRDPDLVLPTLAQALGLRDTAGQPLAATLAAALAERHLLLVLDNFEQVLAAAPQVTQVLAACPQVKALVTSRAVLHVRGEHELVVPPLALPDLARLAPVDELRQYAAVALFVQRARAVKPTFALSPANAPAVAALCRRLDGLPLAIELAAARIKLFGPAALLARLDQRLALLRGGAQDLPERQQTLRQALDWSHDLLVAAEQVLLRRLSVFAGGWTLEAAQAICSPAAGMIEAGMIEAGMIEAGMTGAVGREVAVLDGLTALVDQSLVQWEREAEGEGEGERESEEQGSAAPRFALLETIREYARERLAASGEAPTIERAHATYYLALAERAEPELNGPDQVQWLARLRAEHHNLQAALGWARDAGEVEMGLRLAAALCQYWSRGGYFGEGRTWIEELLTLAGPGASTIDSDVTAATAVTASTRAKALYGAAVLLTSQGVPQRVEAYLQESLVLRRQLADRAGIAEVLVRFGREISIRGEVVRATELLDEALALYRKLGDQRGIAEALDYLAQLARDRGDYAHALAMYEETLILRRAVGDLRGICLSLFNLALMAGSVQHDYPRAVALYGEALTILRSFGERQMIAAALNNLADIADKLGDRAHGLALLEESLSVFRELGRITGVATVLVNMGHIACAQGDTRRATELLHESLQLAWQTRVAQKIAESLEGLAEVAWAERRADAAARLYGTAAALRESAGARILPDDSPIYDRIVTAVRTALGDEAFAAAWAAGRALSLEQALAEALADEVTT